MDSIQYGRNVAQLLVDQQMEINAYREKFSLHTYDRQANLVVFKNETSISEGELTAQQDQARVVEAEKTVIPPEDWSLLTRSYKFTGTEKK